MAQSFAPDAIRACWNTVSQAVPEARFGGIANPGAPRAFGYHNARNNHLRFSPNDYSIQRPDDRAGNGWAGSALDITLPDRLMPVLTQRLIDATLRNDNRVWCVREFFGTVNGRTVTGLDVRDRRWVSADNSHLWHIHISFYRRFATDHSRMQGVAGVLIGTNRPQGGGNLNRDQTEALIAQAMRAGLLGGDRGPFTRKKYPNWVREAARSALSRIHALEQRR